MTSEDGKGSLNSLDYCKKYIASELKLIKSDGTEFDFYEDPDKRTTYIDKEDTIKINWLGYLPSNMRLFIAYVDKPGIAVALVKPPSTNKGGVVTFKLTSSIVEKDIGMYFVS